MTDDKENAVNKRMILGRPRLKIDPAFTAKVMAEVRETKVKLFIPWRKVVLPVCVLLIVVGGGIGAFTYIKQQAGTTIANGASNNPGGSSANGAGDSQQSGKPSNASDYQQLASSAQSDIDTMSLKTGKLSDNDYADTQLADNQIF